MSKKYLIASGCSFTDAGFTSDFHPEMKCDWPKWPEILAEKLEMKSINVGYCGSGNEGIYSRALDTIASFDPKDIGLVIVAWSQSQRRDFEYEFLRNDRDRSQHWTNQRADDKGDLFYYVRRSLRYMYSLQQVCESLNIRYKQFQMISLFYDYIQQARVYHINMDHTTSTYRKMIPERFDAISYMMESPYWDLINEDHFIGWPIINEMNGFHFKERFVRNDSDMIISKEDVHPNEEGQRLIAEKIHEYL